MVNRYTEAYRNLQTSWEALQGASQSDVYTKEEWIRIVAQLSERVKQVENEFSGEFQVSSLDEAGKEVAQKLAQLYDTLMLTQFPYRWIRPKSIVKEEERNLREIESTEKYPALAREGFRRMQYVRGDGNCFYRGVYVHYMDRCLRNPQLLENLKRTIRTLSADPQLSADCQGVLDTLGHLTVAQGEAFHRLCAMNQNFDLAMVRIFRRITSDYITMHKSYKNFMVEEVDAFCKEVNTLGKDGRDTAIPALANALGIKVRIAIMDPGGNFTFTTYGEGEEVGLFLHGEHYDILIK